MTAGHGDRTLGIPAPGDPAPTGASHGQDDRGPRRPGGSQEAGCDRGARHVGVRGDRGCRDSGRRGPVRDGAGVARRTERAVGRRCGRGRGADRPDGHPPPQVAITSCWRRTGARPPSTSRWAPRSATGSPASMSRRRTRGSGSWSSPGTWPAPRCALRSCSCTGPWSCSTTGSCTGGDLFDLPGGGLLRAG